MIKLIFCLKNVVSQFLISNKMNMQILSNYSRQIHNFLLIYRPEKLKRDNSRIYFSFYEGGFYAF